MTHDIETRLDNDQAGYSKGYYARCTCGWRGVLWGLYERGKATLEGSKHQTEMKKKEAAA